MYLYETKTGEAMQGDGFFSPRFDEEQIKQADRVEVWATSFNDAGEYCEFRLMKGDKVLAKSQIRGY